MAAPRWAERYRPGPLSFPPGLGQASPVGPPPRPSLDGLGLGWPAPRVPPEEGGPKSSAPPCSEGPPACRTGPGCPASRQSPWFPSISLCGYNTCKPPQPPVACPPRAPKDLCPPLITPAASSSLSSPRGPTSPPRRISSSPGTSGQHRSLRKAPTRERICSSRGLRCTDPPPPLCEMVVELPPFLLRGALATAEAGHPPGEARLRFGPPFRRGCRGKARRGSALAATRKRRGRLQTPGPGLGPLALCPPLPLQPV